MSISLFSAAKNSIELHGISKSFASQKVLENISLTIKEGEIVALLGASGGGKSTLLNLISGLMPADSGDIAFQGIPAKEFQHWQRIAYLFQEDRLLPWRTVEQNVHFGLENSRSLSRNAVGVWLTRWRWSACRPSSTTGRTSYPAGCAVVWRWRAAWSCTRKFC